MPYQNNPVNLTKILEADKRISQYEERIREALIQMTNEKPEKEHGLLILLGDYYGQDLPEFTYREGQNSLVGQEPKYILDDDFTGFLYEMAVPEKDGAIIVDRGAGQIAAIDVLVDTDIRSEVEPGLGMRHRSASYISSTPRCIGAFVLNETWDAVRIYKNGRQDYVYKRERHG